MNILLISMAILVLAYTLPNLYKEWCGWKVCLEDDEPDYRDKYIG